MNTDKKTEALKLALEALERANNTAFALKAMIPECREFAAIAQDLDWAIPAIREALAEQPAHQQEPVAWLFTNVQSGYIEASTDPYDKQGEREYWHPAPLYTSPQPSKPWVGLTDEDRALCVQATVDSGDAVQLMRAIEAKLREKNA